MLRVLTLSTLFPDATRPNFGGFVERQTLSLAAHPDVDLKVVAPIGLPPGILSRFRHYAPLAKLPHRESWKGVDVHRPRFTALPFTQGRYHAAALERALVPVLDAIRADFAFDVIDVSYFFPEGPAAVALGKRYGVPVSIKARGSDIHYWGAAQATAAQVLEAGRSGAGLLAVSGAMKADMVALGMPADRIAVCHTGVDLNRFRPVDRTAAKAALGIRGPLVMAIGGLLPGKGHDVVIDAVATLPHVTLLIAGAGPARSVLETQIAKLGIADRVRLLGAVPHADLPGMIAAADVTALASKSEGLANVWVESLACGTPIVITNAGGAHEVVTSPEAGRVTIRDPLAFAAAISELLNDPPLPEATRAAVTGFTWAANTASLYAHLSALVAGYPSRG